MEKLPIQISKRERQDKDIKIKINFKRILKGFGPGLLISMAYLDPGNLAGDIDAGINGGYKLISTLLISTLLGWVFQNYAMILGIVTGRDMAQLCKQHYGRKTSILLWAMAEIAIMGGDIQEVLGSAYAINIIFGLPIWSGVLVTIVNTLVLLFVKNRGMKKLELILGILITIMATCFFINLSQIEMDYPAMLTGTIIPTVPKGSEIALIGLIGAVLMPHNLYLHSSIVNEPDRKIDINSDYEVKESIVYGKIDTGISLFISFIVNFSVICTFAYYQGKQDMSLLTAGDALQSSFGKSAFVIWGVGLLASGQSSTLTGTLSGQYVMEGYLNIKMSRFKRSILTRMIAIVPSIIISFLDDMTEFNNYLNALQAIQLPFAIIPMLKLCNNEDIMGKYKISKIMLGVLIFLSTIIVILNYYITFLDLDFVTIKSPIAIIGIFFGIFYFIFMAVLIINELKNLPDQIKVFQLEDVQDSIENVGQTEIENPEIEEIQFEQPGDGSDSKDLYDDDEENEEEGEEEKEDE